MRRPQPPRILAPFKWMATRFNDLEALLREVLDFLQQNSYDPDPEIPSDEPTYVTITDDKIALREVKKYNVAGYPRMGIFGKTTAERYRFVEGDKVEIGNKVRADGGGKYFVVIPGQVEMLGKTIPAEPVLYLPESAIE